MAGEPQPRSALTRPTRTSLLLEVASGHNVATQATNDDRSGGVGSSSGGTSMRQLPAWRNTHSTVSTGHLSLLTAAPPHVRDHSPRRRRPRSGAATRRSRRTSRGGGIGGGVATAAVPVAAGEDVRSTVCTGHLLGRAVTGVAAGCGSDRGVEEGHMLSAQEPPARRSPWRGEELVDAQLAAGWPPGGRCGDGACRCRRACPR